VPHHEIAELMRFTLGFHGHEIAEEQSRHHGRRHALLRRAVPAFALWRLHEHDRLEK
jgi:hypothetical protein